MKKLSKGTKNYIEKLKKYEINHLAHAKLDLISSSGKNNWFDFAWEIAKARKCRNQYNKLLHTNNVWSTEIKDIINEINCVLRTIDFNNIKKARYLAEREVIINTIK